MSPSRPEPTTAPLAVQLFGGLQLRRRGAWLCRPFPTLKSAGLFAHLLLRAGQPANRDYLAGTFWPEIDLALARRSLSQALLPIRHLLFESDLGPEAGLVDSEAGIRLRLPPDAWVDVWEFWRCLSLQKRADPGSEEWRHLGERAVALYTGDLLPDVEEHWLENWPGTLRRSVLECLHDLMRVSMEQGAADRAMRHAHRALQIEPADEESHRCLIRLYLRQRERARALRQLRECRQILRELGAPLDPETQCLAEAIRAPASLGAPAAGDAFPGPYPELSGPLAGREPQAAALHDAWLRACSGRGGLLFLVGPAGSGKSRLGHALLDAAAGSGGLALYAPAADPNDPGRCHPLVEPLRQALQRVQDCGLAPCPPVWEKTVMRLLREPHSTAALQSRQAREAVTQFFLHLARQRPVCFFLDDLQRADAVTGLSLHQLGCRVRAARLLLVGAYRLEEVASDGWLADWIASVQAQRTGTFLTISI